MASSQCIGEALKQGKNIIIFPVGTRTKTGEVNEFKKTFVILSMTAVQIHADLQSLRT